jgi:hypothetical protein
MTHHGNTINLEGLVVFIMHFLKIAVVGIDRPGLVRQLKLHREISHRQKKTIG